jgi:hypothetical protein
LRIKQNLPLRQSLDGVDWMLMQFSISSNGCGACPSHLGRVRPRCLPIPP